MKQQIAQLTSILVLGMTVAAHSADREFTSADGSKTFKGSVTSFSPNSGNVSVKRSDGRKLSFPAAKLSKPDQQYLKEWYTKTHAGRSIALNIEEVANEGVERKTSNAKVKPVQGGYKLSFRNNGQDDLKDLNVKYQIFYINDGEKKPVSVREKGEENLDLLSARMTETVETDSVTLTRIKPLPASQCAGGT